MNATLSSPTLLDVTIRDGGFLIDHMFTPKMVGEIVSGLKAAGIRWAEISHGLGIGARIAGFPAEVDDEALLEAAKAADPELKISVMVSTLDFSLPVLPGLVEFFDMGRILVNPDQVPAAEKLVAKLNKYGKKSSIQLTRMPAYSTEVIAQAAKQASDLGVDILYAVDSFGSLTPQETVSYVDAIRSNFQATIGFHGHNHSGMAIANSMAAWKAGATWLDGSLMGVGRGAGNASLEILAALLQSEGIRNDIRLAELCATTEQAVLPIFQRPPRSRLVDMLGAVHRVDVTPPELLEVFASSLHLSVQEFVIRARKTMGDAPELKEEHLRTVFKEAGRDYDLVVSSLRGKKGPA